MKWLINRQVHVIKKTKDGYQRRIVKGIKTFLKNERKRSNQMIPKDKTKLPKKEEQKLGEYIKSYYNMWKNLLYFKYKP